jgi:hypothetical protein
VADTIEELQTQFFAAEHRRALNIPLPEDVDPDAPRSLAMPYHDSGALPSEG